MSDTQTATPAKPIPNYSCTIRQGNTNGESHSQAQVTYGEPVHTIVVREPDMGDQFDLLEIAGAAADSETWMAMAIIAISVQHIDETPAMSIRGDQGAAAKDTLRRIIKKLGPIGMAAANKAIGELTSGGNASVDATVNAAKN